MTRVHRNKDQVQTKVCVYCGSSG